MPGHLDRYCPCMQQLVMHAPCPLASVHWVACCVLLRLIHQDQNVIPNIWCTQVWHILILGRSVSNVALDWTSIPRSNCCLNWLKAWPRLSWLVHETTECSTLSVNNIVIESILQMKAHTPTPPWREVYIRMIFIVFSMSGHTSSIAFLSCGSLTNCSTSSM